MATDPQVLKTIADILSRVENLERMMQDPKPKTRVSRIRPTTNTGETDGR